MSQSGLKVLTEEDVPKPHTKHMENSPKLQKDLILAAWQILRVVLTEIAYFLTKLVERGLKKT